MLNLSDRPEGAALRLTDVSREFVTRAERVSAVAGVSLDAQLGEFLCVSGTSGSGKSTLLNLMAGLDLPTRGEVEALGRRLDTMTEDARADFRLAQIGMIFQDDALIAEFTATENVALPQEARGGETSAAMDEADQLLELVGLKRLGPRLPRELSGGQRQRVGVARALIGNRRIVLADEPTGALDSQTSADLFELLRRVSRTGVCVIVCSHDPSCRLYADRILEMADGHLTEAHARTGSGALT